MYEDEDGAIGLLCSYYCLGNAMENESAVNSGNLYFNVLDRFAFFQKESGVKSENHRCTGGLYNYKGLRGDCSFLLTSVVIVRNSNNYKIYFFLNRH